MTDVSTLTQLLPLFRQCEQYADRLAFWQEHNLTNELYYDTVEVEGIYYPVDFLNQRIQCRTWEAVKNLPILTLTPFTRDEARQFFQWALSVRPDTNPYVNSFQTLRDEFTEQYAHIERNREMWLTEQRNAASRWADDKVFVSHAQRKNIGRLFGIDLETFSEFARSYNEARWPDLVSHIRLSRVVMSWEPVDTYLFAKAKYEFAVYLENVDSQQLPGSASQSVPMPTASIPLLHTVQQARQALFDELAPYVDQSKRTALSELILMHKKPAERIVISCMVKTLGASFCGVGAVLPLGAKLLSEQLPEYFVRNDGVELVPLRPEVLVKHLRGKY